MPNNEAKTTEESEQLTHKEDAAIVLFKKQHKDVNDKLRTTEVREQSEET
jgi:hypothetical protein